MIRLAAAGAVFALLAGALPAFAHELPREQVVSAAFQPQLGTRVPLESEFVDEDGAAVRLGDYFDGKPVILSLNYFHCQYVCPIEEDGLINALNGISLTLGRDFTLLTVSIDPKDGPADATAIKARAIRGYDRPQAADGWHLLTGDAGSIQQLTQALGFQYVADPQQGDFAHPIGVTVLGGDGHVSGYLSGVDFAAAALRQALVGADQPTPMLPVICYQYDPLTGRYTPLALTLVRVGGAVGFLALLLWLATLWRADLRRAGA